MGDGTPLVLCRAFFEKLGVQAMHNDFERRFARMAQRGLFSMTRRIFLTTLLALALPSFAAEKIGGPIRVAVYEGPGAGPSRSGLIDVLTAGKDRPVVEVSSVAPEAVRKGALKDVDVLIHPGGSGGGQGRALAAEGREAVREFVRKGGGFIGICAGAYLATDDYEWSLGLIEARVVDKRHWARGNGTVEVTLSPVGQGFFGTKTDQLAIYYGQGPLLSRREWDNPLAPEYESLGIYRTGIAEKGAPEGIMPGTSAIVRTTFEKGRVFVFSPHPEKTGGLGFMLERAVQWVAQREPLDEATGEIECPAISDTVRRYFPEGSDGGVALLVVRDGQILHRKGYGAKDGAPVTPDTPMGLASVSKQFTAMCAAFLIEEGRLKLTDKVADHLPDVQLPTDGRELLVQDLLWHTSGLADFIKTAEKPSITAYKKAHDITTWTNAVHAGWIATRPLKHPPGTRHEYTNGGYALLARLVEVISGRPFHQFQQERIFDVLGMNQARAVSQRFNGAGNVEMSLNDYAKWDRALREGRLVKPATWQRMTQSGTLDDGAAVGYGFGWQVTHENGELVEMMHGGSGSPPGNSRNIVLRDLRHDLTVAFFSRENVQYTRDLRDQIARVIRDCALALK